MKKIAFCFLIDDGINHEELWNTFFKNVDINTYNIYIHYKHNKPLKYFEKHKLNNCIETSYASITLVNAQNVLLKEGITDIYNEHFIFISGSCIPLKSFKFIYNKLNKENSYFNINPKSQCFPNCNSVTKYIDEKYINKASYWCILNRKHAELMLNNSNYITWFNSVNDSVEHCYITNIFYNNLQHEIIATPNLANDATTFINSSDMDYKYSSMRGLKNYSFIEEEELLYLINSKCLFGRKFNVECNKSLSVKKYIEFITSYITLDDISVYIFNWHLVTENSIKLYKNITPIISDTWIINCDEKHKLDKSIKHIQLDDSHYYGSQYNHAIKHVKDNKLFCCITGDNVSNNDFKNLFESVINTFNELNVGIYSPNDKRSPHIVRYEVIKNNLYNVENTDCGFWVIHPKIVEKLKFIDYSITKYGWGIDIITILESRKMRLLVLRDYSIETDQLTHGCGYSNNIQGARNGMKQIIELYKSYTHLKI